MKRILIYGMTKNRGGIESYIYNYYRFMDRSNITFDFVSEDEEIAYGEEFKAFGSSVYYIVSRREGLFKHITSLRKIIKNGRYDAVYYNLLSASAVFSVMASSGLRGVKTIVHSHNNSVKNLGTHLKLRPLLNLLTDQRLSCSVPATDFMFGEKHRKDTIIINNAIDLEQYRFDPAIRAQVRAEFGLGDAFTVGHVGRLCYQKNTLFLLDIFFAVLKKMPDAHLLLIGEGEDRAEVEQKILDLGIKENVTLAGMRSDVPRLMQAMDLFLLPSRFEGLPVVGIEAQAAGLPCFFADTFTHDTAITDKVTFIPLEATPVEWAEAIMACKGATREDRSGIIRKQGFDIREGARKLQRTLTEF